MRASRRGRVAGCELFPECTAGLSLVVGERGNTYDTLGIFFEGAAGPVGRSGDQLLLINDGQLVVAQCAPAPFHHRNLGLPCIRNGLHTAASGRRLIDHHLDPNPSSGRPLQRIRQLRMGPGKQRQLDTPFGPIDLFNQHPQGRGLGHQPHLQLLTTRHHPSHIWGRRPPLLKQGLIIVPEPLRQRRSLASNRQIVMQAEGAGRKIGGADPDPPSVHHQQLAVHQPAPRWRNQRHLGGQQAAQLCHMLPMRSDLHLHPPTGHVIARANQPGISQCIHGNQHRLLCLPHSCDQLLTQVIADLAAPQQHGPLARRQLHLCAPPRHHSRQHTD